MRLLLMGTVLLLGSSTAVSLGFQGSKQKANHSLESPPRTKVELSDEKRRAIWEELIKAEDFSIWAANRLFDPVSQYQELSKYQENSYEGRKRSIAKKYKISVDDLDPIVIEGLEKEWKPAKHPSFDVKAAAKEIKCTVYSNRDELTYHRKSCPLLGKNDAEVVSLSLHKALSTKGNRACSSCLP